jgi:hypothetical protein
MVTRGRTAKTAGAAATRSPTTTTTATRAAAPKAAPSPTRSTRKTITQSSAGQAAQASFKQAVSSAAQSVGVNFGVPTLKTTIQETETEIITVTEKPEVIIEEPVIEEPIIEEPIIELPELLPEVFAEETRLSADIIQIINDIESGVILVPDWFYNNIEWVKNGHISEHEFRTAYNYLAEQQIAHPPEQNLAITDNMVTQRLDNFSIVNGRAIGQITFTATENFNPNYYGKNITNVIQFKTPNGVNILPFIKQNTLRFTATERTETIQYDEGMENNTRATLESFVWSDVTTPTAFSKKLSYEISETDAPKPVGVTGIMGAGVGGAIGILILLGFIADSRRKK